MKITSLKQEILDYFTNDRSYQAGIALYMKYGAKVSFKRKLNSLPESEHFKGLLLEELREIAGISNIEFQQIIKKPVKLLPKSVKKIIEEKKPDPTPKTLTDIPVSVKKTIRLREEFPFLKEKDCPKELKIMVADMITEHEKYCEVHKSLFDAATTEDIANICGEILDNYIDNREIWNELTHYKEKGEVLGEHPIFTLEEIFKGLKEMSAKELSKRKTSLESDIRRNKKLIEDNERPDLLTNRQSALMLKEQELIEIDKLLASK